MKGKASAKCAVGDLCRVLSELAPLELAQSWDNVGLLAGDDPSPVRRVLLCIDLTPAVMEEALSNGTDFIMAYHPPLFKPITRLCSPSGGTEAAVYTCVRNGIALYSMHTALDAAPCGTNDVIAEMAGVTQAAPLEYVSRIGAAEFKLVVFVPTEAVETVAEAIFAAGAGHIGDYSHCSYCLEGTGTFLGGESTSPTIGERGKLEHVREARLEMVVPAPRLADVLRAMRMAHPYEEPAYDVYPRAAEPVHGIGRVGKLEKPITAAALARKLKRLTVASNVQIVGDKSRQRDRAVIVVGSAGQLPFCAGIGESEVVITGEIRHHDALAIARSGAAAIALGHWGSERPVLSSLCERIRQRVRGLEVQISQADCDPFESS